MNLITDMANLTQSILEDKDNGFAISVTIADPATGETAIVTGLAVKPSISVDGAGGGVNSTRSSVTFHEKTLLDADYPTRNDQGDIALGGHLVTWTDSLGQTLTYKIGGVYPDETIGTIICELEYYEDI